MLLISATLSLRWRKMSSVGRDKEDGKCERRPSRYWKNEGGREGGRGGGLLGNRVRMRRYRNRLSTSPSHFLPPSSPDIPPPPHLLQARFPLGDNRKAVGIDPERLLAGQGGTRRGEGGGEGGREGGPQESVEGSKVTVTVRDCPRHGRFFLERREGRRKGGRKGRREGRREGERERGKAEERRKGGNEGERIWKG
jgi:hypothetical protein